MSVRIVRLGSPRVPNEGTRIGTVRRPPRGVPKTEFASGNWYDVWFPNLAPSVETMKAGLAATTDREWAAFERRYRAEMNQPDDLEAELARNPEARRFFESLNSTNRFAVLYRIQTAVRPETRARRIAQLVEKLARGEKLHP